MFSEKPTSVDRKNSTEISLKKNMKVEKKAELLLPKLETYLIKSTQKIEEINYQLNQTRMVGDGVWKEARKRVKATKDIFKQLNASSFYFEKSKVISPINLYINFTNVIIFNSI